jgi:hypothetical protein
MRFRGPVLVAGLLLVLLAGVATLQYRWIGELAGLERQRMRSRLEAASAAFGEDFDRELSRLFSPASLPAEKGSRRRSSKCNSPAGTARRLIPG